MWNPYEELSSGQRRALGVGSVLTVLVIWSLLSGLELVSPARLPAPWDVASAFVRLSWDGERGQSLLLEATLYSVSRVVIAGVLVFVIGTPMGIFMGASPKVNAILSPLIDPFRSAPVVALLPIIVMWFGIEEESKIVFLFLGAVVFLVPLVRDAMLAVPQEHWISARDLGATPWEAIRKSVLPMARPRIADAFVVAVSVMWTYITVAEYYNAQQGLGQLIANARRLSAMDQVFVGIFVIITLALVTYGAMVWVKRRLYPWESEL